MDTRERQESERTFFDELYGRGWHGENQPIDEQVVPRNMLVYWNLVRDHVLQAVAETPSLRVLDCGCGYGVLSVLLAKIGARVTAVDVSPNSIDIVGRVARVNGVEDRIEARVLGLEDLPFDDVSFDVVVGTRILHHVDIARAGAQLARVLKPGGRALFWECTEKNPILRFARTHLRRIFPLPKYGTEGEHPLTSEEIALLEACFGSTAEIVAAPFYFFTLMDEYIFRRRMKAVSAMLGGLDAFVAKYLPFLNHFSFHQILLLESRAVPHEEVNLIDSGRVGGPADRSRGVLET